MPKNISSTTRRVFTGSTDEVQRFRELRNMICPVGTSQDFGRTLVHLRKYTVADVFAHMSLMKEIGKLDAKSNFDGKKARYNLNLHGTEKNPFVHVLHGQIYVDGAPLDAFAPNSITKDWLISRFRLGLIAPKDYTQ